MHFYVFNITNVEEVQAGAKPALQQLGPYTYTKHSRKLDARFDVAGRVHFKPYTFYTVSPATRQTLQGWIAALSSSSGLVCFYVEGLMYCLARPGVPDVLRDCVLSCMALVSPTVW